MFRHGYPIIPGALRGVSSSHKSHLTPLSRKYFRNQNQPCRRWQSNPPVPSPTDPYYVTTPIYYVNAAPHIGHLYSSVLADIAARYARLRRPDRTTLFCTGTDEHGMKIQKAAEDNKMDPQDFCDRISERFKSLASAADISYTRFIRTTEAGHKDTVQYFWNELQRRGYIYKGSHSGWYSISDETFYGESQVHDIRDEASGDTYKVSKESGSRVEWTSEENYMFRLSAFRGTLIEWLKANPKAIVPASRHTEILSSLLPEGSLQDLSISRPRSRLSWGIPVPGDPEHTIYVWLDALTNYITALGYPWGESQQQTGWPADIQVIGKDIARFHTIYWPAFLVALGLSPPRTVLVHAHWTMEKSKMSKSKGNVVNPFDVMNKYGVDAVRYYLARIGGISQDADWSEEQVLKHYSRDLAGVLGNFVSRIGAPKLVAKLPKEYPHPLLVDRSYISNNGNMGDAALHSMIYGSDITSGLLAEYEERMENMEYNKALEGVMNMVTEANRNFHQMAVWSPETSNEKLIRTHFYSWKSLHIAGVLLQPFMPTKSVQLLNMLSIPEEERTWSHLEAEIRPLQARPGPETVVDIQTMPTEQRTYSKPQPSPMPVLFPRIV